VSWIVRPAEERQSITARLLGNNRRGVTTRTWLALRPLLIGAVVPAGACPGLVLMLGGVHPLREIENLQG
jgi:hypothetical protein